MRSVGIEVVVFPEAYQRAATLIETGTLVLVRGKLERDDETVRTPWPRRLRTRQRRERVAHEVAFA